MIMDFSEQKERSQIILNIKIGSSSIIVHKYPLLHDNTPYNTTVEQRGKVLLSTAHHNTVQKTLCISNIHTLYIYVLFLVRLLARSSAVVVLNVRSTKISIQHIHTNTLTSIDMHTYALPAAHRHSHTLRSRMLIPKQQSVVFADRVYS